MNQILDFLAHRNIHKLAGTALAVFGITATNWRDMTLGAGYAAIMHIVGAIKGVPDAPIKSPVA
jgi:hypothetical protein